MDVVVFLLVLGIGIWLNSLYLKAIKRDLRNKGYDAEASRKIVQNVTWWDGWGIARVLPDIKSNAGDEKRLEAREAKLAERERALDARELELVEREEHTRLKENVR